MYSEAMKQRLDKLDTAFLFVISVIGLMITIIQGYSNGILGIIVAFPILVLGMPLPFYIGYVRAAISLPQTEEAVFERLRGWGYLIFGVGAYMSLIAPTLPSLLPYGILLYFGILLISALFAGFMQSWFMKAFEVGRDPIHQISYFGSIASAAFFAIAFGFSISSYVHWTPLVSPSYFSIILDVYIVAAAVIVGIIFEKTSRMITSDRIPLSEKQIKGVVQGSFIGRAIVGIWIVFGHIIGACRRASVLWIVGIFIAFPAAFIQESPSVAYLSSLTWLTVPVSITCLVTSFLLIITGAIYFMKTPKLSDKILDI